MAHIISFDYLVQKIRGWLQNLKNMANNISMNLRQRENLLTENIQLKKEKVELERKLTDLMIMLEGKMDLMVDALNQIKDKPSVVNQIVTKDSLVTKINTTKDNMPIFIPTPDSSNLKMNVQDLHKTRKKINIQDSLDKLSQLKEKP